MILFIKLVNHNCTDQTAGWSVPLLFANALDRFSREGLLNVKIIKEGNSSVGPIHCKRAIRGS